MSNVRTGLIYSFVGKFGLKILNLISTVLIARLLTPTEIGTFAIASSVVMILAEVKLLGAGVYLIRADSLDDEKIRKAYGITFIMCWSIALILILGSSSLAEFFKESSLENVFFILACNFFLAPYISIPDALLVRKYLFKQISIISLISVLIQLVITLILISHGFGFMALAWGQFASMLVRMILSLYLTRDVKVYKPSFNDICHIAKLGIYTSLAHVLRRFNYTAADLVIGRMGTPQEVGMFSRGMGYIDFIGKSFFEGVGAVAQPYMSDMKRQGNNMCSAYIKATVLLCSLLWPVLIVSGIAALPAIRLLFGDQWDSAAPIALLLSVWACIRIISFFSPAILISDGHESLLFKRDLLLFFILLSSLIILYPYGLTTLPYAFIFTSIVELFLTLYLLKFKFKLRFFNLFYELSKPLALAIGCLLSVLFLNLLYDFQEGSPLLIFLMIFMIMPPVWLTLAKQLNLQIYFEAVRSMKSLSGRFIK